MGDLVVAPKGAWVVPGLTQASARAGLIVREGTRAFVVGFTIDVIPAMSRLGMTMERVVLFMFDRFCSVNTLGFIDQGWSRATMIRATFTA